MSTLFCSETVCCVRLSQSASMNYSTRPIFTKLLCMLGRTYCRGSVLLWQRANDTLRTSGFMDDVMFAHNE